MSNSAIIETKYLLTNLKNGIAHIELSYVISTTDIDNADGFADFDKEEGAGKGLILYNTIDKQVELLEYDLEIHSYLDMDNMSVERTTTSHYKWTMNVLKN